MFESLKKEIMRELPSKVLEKKPSDDNELKDLVGMIVEEKIKK